MTKLEALRRKNRLAPGAVAASLAVVTILSGCSQDAGNHSENCTKLMSQAVQAAHANNYAKAEDLLRNAITEAARGDDLLRQPEAWTQMGDTQRQADEPEQAEGSYRQALKLYEDILKAKSGDTLQRRSVAKTHAEVSAKLADVLDREGRLKDAESQYRLALEEGKQCFITLELQNDITRRLAEVLTKMNKKSESVQLQSDVMANEGEKTAKSALREGEALLDKGADGARVRFVSALTMAKQRNQPREASSALYFLAQMELWDGQLSRSQKYAEEGYELAKSLPNNKEQLCFGLTLLGAIKEALGDKQTGEKLVKEATQLDGCSCASEFSGIASHFYGRHNYGQAAKYFRRAIDVLDQHPTAWTRGDQTRAQWRQQNLEALANCYSQIQQDDAAHKAYTELLTENAFLPADVRARYLQLDAITSFKLGKVVPAEKQLEEEISILKSQNLPKERLSLALGSMAYCYMKQNRNKDAEDCFRQAIENTPEGVQRAVYERNLAKTYMKEGKYEESSQLFEKLLPWKDKMILHNRDLFLRDAAESFRKAHRDAEADQIESSLSEKPI